MHRPQSRFASPGWLICSACAIGIAQFPALLFCVLAIGSFASGCGILCVLSLFGFRLSLHCLVEGRMPRSKIDVAVDALNGRARAREHP